MAKRNNVITENYGKFVNLKKSIAAKHENWTDRQVAIAARKILERENGAGTPVSELKLFASTEKKLVEAGLTTVEAVKAASDKKLAEAGLSEKAVKAVRNIIGSEAEAPKAEKPAEEKAPVKKATSFKALDLFESTRTKLVEAKLTSIKKLREASEEMLVNAGLSERAAKAVKAMVA